MILTKGICFAYSSSSLSKSSLSNFSSIISEISSYTGSHEKAFSNDKEYIFVLELDKGIKSDNDNNVIRILVYVNDEQTVNAIVDKANKCINQWLFKS